MDYDELTMIKKSTIANRIKTRREKMGLTQEQVAEKLGTNQSTYSLWEVGKYLPRGITRRKLADIFKMDIEALFNDKPDASERADNEEIEKLKNEFSRLKDEILSNKRRLPRPGISGHFHAEADPTIGEINAAFEDITPAHWKLLLRIFTIIASVDHQELPSILDVIERFQDLQHVGTKVKGARAKTKVRK